MATEDLKTARKRRQSNRESVLLPPKVNYLSEKSLQLHERITEKLSKPIVPPASPKDVIFDYSFTSLPRDFPSLADLPLPCVREVGVRAAIEQLAEHFQCQDYKFNLIQFWFLDIITDCLWRAQDEFQFPGKHQKIILEWILYIFNLIRAQHLNLSKKKLFSLFKEAMSIAEDYIQSGCESVPLPHELFTLNSEQEKKGESYTTLDSSGSTTSTDSTISLESSSAASSYVAVKFGDNTEYFKLPVKTCPWDSDEECMSTSIETLSELGLQKLFDKGDLNPVEEVEEEEEEEIDFYKPTRGIPARFVPSRMSFGLSFSISFDSILMDEESSSEESKGAAWVDEARKPESPPCPSQLTLKIEAPRPPPPLADAKSKKGDKKPYKPTVVEEPVQELDDKEILQAWFEYHLWQYRLEEMKDPQRGWDPKEEVKNVDEDTTEWAVEDENKEAKAEWMEYLKNRRNQMRAMKENIFVNTCVLIAIKQFVFDYFYETFLFTLLKIAFRCSHSLLTQEINDKWAVPKIIKAALKKPKPKKPKKEKKPKKPKSKKDKKKKSAKGKQKKEKKEKKPKKEKPKKLTKEEKAELARLKKEQERLEEERRKAEENRWFMFPLGEAATDEFFKDVFENWVRVEKGKKDKKGKKKK